MGCSRRVPVFDHGCGRVPQRDHHFDVGGGTVQGIDCQGIGMLFCDGGQRPPTLPHPGLGRLAAWQIDRPPLASHPRISGGAAAGRPDPAANAGVWLQRVVRGPTQCPSEATDRHQLWRRSPARDLARGRIFVPASQAHDEGKTGRREIQEGSPRAKTLKKRALEEASSTVLIFQDEMEIHRHPALTRMWAPVGQQPEIPAPGKNEKQVVYGGVNYKTGKLTYTLAATKCGTEFLVFLMTLVKQYVGKKIILVCDNGRFHTTKAVQAWLEEHRQQITVYWLPPYSPSLNLIERLWGHLKRTVLANVLYDSLDDLVSAFKQGVRRLTSKRDAMGFMYNHDDLTQELHRAAA